MTTPSSITSSELNFLVFRYLQESGFTHAAFALGYEAGINKTNIDGNLIPPGALITFVQKGLQYVELEANLESDKLEGDDDFSFLQPLDLITKDVSELQRIMKEKKQNIQKEREAEKEKRDKDKEKQERDRDKVEKVKELEREKDREKQHKEQKDNFAEDHEDNKAKGKSEENGVCGGPEPMDITPTPQFVASEIHSSEVTILEGHGSEVFACAWSPTGSLLASGSGDSTARIWTIPDGPCGSSMLPPQVHVLKHFKGRTNEKSKDVTTLDWNGEGTLLATGSYDGQARIWSKDGELKNTLAKHKGPIFSLKWNKKGDYLLSGSVDKTAIVWDTRTWECRQQFEFHSAPALDVDWRNNVSFATCSTDNMIYVCKIGEGRPVKAFAGHQGEVNAIKWDPTGSLLASCSDDGTAKGHLLVACASHKMIIPCNTSKLLGVSCIGMMQQFYLRDCMLLDGLCISLHFFKKHGPIINASEELYFHRLTKTFTHITKSFKKLLLLRKLFMLTSTYSFTSITNQMKGQ